jgi:hypothetical protein
MCGCERPKLRSTRSERACDSRPGSAAPKSGPTPWHATQRAACEALKARRLPSATWVLGERVGSRTAPRQSLGSGRSAGTRACANAGSPRQAPPSRANGGSDRFSCGERRPSAAVRGHGMAGILDRGAGECEAAVQSREPADVRRTGPSADRTTFSGNRALRRAYEAPAT